MMLLRIGTTTLRDVERDVNLKVINADIVVATGQEGGEVTVLMLSKEYGAEFIRLEKIDECLRSGKWIVITP